MEKVGGINRRKPVVGSSGWEHKPKSPEFPPLTPEDLEEIRVIYRKLWSKYGNHLRPVFVFRKYTGLKEPLGGGDTNTKYFNSNTTFGQFLFALAMTRHPLVKQMASPDFDVSKFDEEELVKSKIMAGMKILDLGSGPQPTFSRYCRVMGAEVWTLDLKPDTYLRWGSSVAHKKDTEFLTPAQVELEDRYHIELDLVQNKGAATIIGERSGGNFNLITEANLVGGKVYVNENKIKTNVALPLLKKGGLYFGDGTEWPLRAELKE